MPRPRPPYLHRQITRHGKTVWYLRKKEGGVGSRIRLRALFGTPQFDAEYRAALDAVAPMANQPNRASAGSLQWLWGEFRKAGEWTSLKHNTRRQRENIMAHVIN